MYFLRLARLKPAAEEIAKETWEGLSVWNLLFKNSFGEILSTHRLFLSLDCRGTCAPCGASTGRETG